MLWSKLLLKRNVTCFLISYAAFTSLCVRPHRFTWLPSIFVLIQEMR